jgi:hypothetical protein
MPSKALHTDAPDHRASELARYREKAKRTNKALAVPRDTIEGKM